MRKAILYSFLLCTLLQCHTGYAIRCYSCLGECDDATIIPCNPNEQCMIRELKLEHGRREQQKGCLSERMCGMTMPDPQLTQWCCNTENCNYALPGEQTTTSMPMTNASTASMPITNASTARSPSTSSAVIRPPASPLTCFSCDFICMGHSTVVCEVGQVCVTTKKKTIGIPLKKYGCANVATCNQEVEEVFWTTTSDYNQCCDTNFCNLEKSDNSTNSAVTTRLPAITAIGAVLVLWLTRLS